jgi:hypothetical protein
MQPVPLELLARQVEPEKTDDLTARARTPLLEPMDAFE